jgi:hypothetical protein
MPSPVKPSKLAQSTYQETLTEPQSGSQWCLRQLQQGIGMATLTAAISHSSSLPMPTLQVLV